MPVLIVVTIAALVMAVLLPVSGVLSDRFGPRRVYLVGVVLYGLATFPVFALFGSKNLVLFGLAMVVVFASCTRFSTVPRARFSRRCIRPEAATPGLSFVYQFSGIYASGVTPMILTALIAALHGAPWLACGYLVGTAVISVVATSLIRERDLYL